MAELEKKQAARRSREGALGDQDPLRGDLQLAAPGHARQSAGRRHLRGVLRLQLRLLQARARRHDGADGQGPEAKVVLKEFPVLGPSSAEAAQGRGRGAHAGQDRQEVPRIPPEAADRARPGRQGARARGRQGDRPRHGAAREGPEERRDRRDAGREHEARRGARPQRHAELRDRQRRRDRRGRACASSGQKIQAAREQ